MRIMLAVAALILTLASTACGSDSKSTPTAKAVTPVASAGRRGEAVLDREHTRSERDRRADKSGGNVAVAGRRG